MPRAESLPVVAAKKGKPVRVMAAVQLGRTVDDPTAGDIVAFLESLTGEVPQNYAPPGERVAGQR